MAQQQLVVHIDDLDGKELAEEDHHLETFAANGYVYELDMSTKHRAAFMSALEKYTSKARVVGRFKHGQVSAYRGARTHAAGDLTQKIRAWARTNGYPDISDRGRIPAEVTQAYEAAQVAEAEQRTTRKRKTSAAAPEPEPEPHD